VEKKSVPITFIMSVLYTTRLSVSQYVLVLSHEVSQKSLWRVLQISYLMFSGFNIVLPSTSYGLKTNVILEVLEQSSNEEV
jgi:hypothetical protein